jgi:hypothetical protein
MSIESWKYQNKYQINKKYGLTVFYNTSGK